MNPDFATAITRRRRLSTVAHGFGTAAAGEQRIAQGNARWLFDLSL